MYMMEYVPARDKKMDAENARKRLENYRKAFINTTDEKTDNKTEQRK
jgi:hypothetical protein